MAVGRDDVPEPLAGEVFLGDGVVVVAVVAEEMLCDGVGHDFIHVDANSLLGFGTSSSFLFYLSPVPIQFAPLHLPHWRV